MIYLSVKVSITTYIWDIYNIINHVFMMTNLGSKQPESVTQTTVTWLPFGLEPGDIHYGI